MSNKHNAKQPADRPRVDPLGDLKIAESRGKYLIIIHFRVPRADKEGDI